MSKHVLHRLDGLGHRLAPGRTRPSQWLAAVPVGMLTTTGARSGQPRTVPLMLAPLEDGWGVIASHYGSERPPAWYFNLRAHPQASLEVDGVVHRVRAEQVQGPDRERVREAALGFYRGYTAYEQRAGRARPRLLRAAPRARLSALGVQRCPRVSAHSGSPSASRR